ncbi:MAG: efflux RND transporter periplasmic adaptor subunit [Georgfuchsia sp.]
MRKTGATDWMALMTATLIATGAHAQPLATEIVQAGAGVNTYSAEGAVEAVRSSVIGAELAGRVTALLVKAGDRVKTGQVLARIDQRIANQQALASQSQVAAAEAQLAAAQADFERRQKLYEQKFLSKAALDRAESDYKSAAAQARAQIAQATAAGVQTGLHTLTAPYDGVVAETSIELGDMVMPGRPLLLVYDPAALRVTVNLPQSQLANLKRTAATVEIPGAKTPFLNIAQENVNVLPTADPVSHMVQVRIALPAATGGLTPGMFARAQLPLQGPAATGRVTVPSAAVITRSELTAVYVVDDGGRASLRQVRLGRHQGDRIEVLAGLEAGEKVALDPLAAAKQL